MNYTVYLHRNLKNQKVYIGQTCQSVQKRWNNGKGYISSPHLCIETGKVFDSLMEAGKFYNISIGNISSILSGKRKTADGYHWKRIENL